MIASIFMTAVTVFLLGCIFVMISPEDPKDIPESVLVAWYISQVSSFCVAVVSGIWWIWV